MEDLHGKDHKILVDYYDVYDSMKTVSRKIVPTEITIPREGRFFHTDILINI